ncbi:MAG: restriction endonuclease subunit S, partial [Nitrospirae bacterium]|nr:restriction endonuclease subunit S [Nitrospirota bacterium]
MKNAFPIKLLRTLAREIFAGVSLYNIHEYKGTETLPTINIKDIFDGQINEANLSHIHTINLKNIKKSMVLPYDVIITSRGTQLKIAAIPNSLNQAVITSNLIAIRLGEQMLPGFLAAYLKSTVGQQALLSRATSSTTQLVLTISQIEEMKVPVPPLSLQEKIANFANAVEEQYRLSIESAN